MSISPWFDDLPVLGALSLDETIIKLREVGEDDVANALETAQNIQPSEEFGLLDWFTNLEKPYLHTAHAFGYISPFPSSDEVLPVLPTSSIQADSSLRSVRLIITLGLLRVADYPGKGMQQILLHFSAQNHVPRMVEQ